MYHAVLKIQYEDTIKLLKYKIDIRRDTNINHFSGQGKLI